MADGTTNVAAERAGDQRNGNATLAGLLQQLVARLGATNVRLNLCRVAFDRTGDLEALALLRRVVGSGADVVRLRSGNFGVLRVAEPGHQVLLETRFARLLADLAARSPTAPAVGVRLACLAVWSSEVVDAAWTVRGLEAAPERLVLPRPG